MGLPCLPRDAILRLSLYFDWHATELNRWGTPQVATAAAETSGVVRAPSPTPFAFVDIERTWRTTADGDIVGVSDDEAETAPLGDIAERQASGERHYPMPEEAGAFFA